MPAKQAWLKKMKVEHGNKHVDKVTIDQLIGGTWPDNCPGVTSLDWQTGAPNAK